MDGLHHDLAIAGGGLAGGLTALAVHRARPDLKLLLVEGETRLGGNHVWSFFSSDVDAEGLALLQPMIAQSWDGYDVRFPARERRLSTRYHSIRSADFDRVVRAALPVETVRLGAEIADVAPDAIMLASGETIAARAVLDCRGGGDLSALDCGWQKFAGLELELAAPHGLARPIVMDAGVEQIDGYRFVYVLPFGEKRLFVEDTYYSDGPELDADAIEARILAYAQAQGWAVDRVAARETGVLPVVIGGDFERYWQAGGKAAKAGVRAGLFHPVTGYSLPDAVAAAHFIARLLPLDGVALAEKLHRYAKDRWTERGYYRMLDTMLFRAAEPDERYRIFERFYGLGEPLIERFYSASSTLADKIRILSGRPPVPVHRAVRALASSRGAGKR
ncbi:lycopene beta-cyclase CrtY [Parasphingopyxis marina]|uniref:Lycopene beta-cyclase CrtY n=1 Tax=Parasphingopyxis marina TaxID=2761622 RepID=A0A842HVI7_9SPHN|nr:lycopene beta-cyclase CrtY [Parasphingopyxis marina]MBC2776391.1 lycopene beta-cyclase CrtY [Parasphingopyxis marina]